MYGNFDSCGNADGDLFEYINFQQRYNIDARIERAKEPVKEVFLEPIPGPLKPQNVVDLHIQWLQSSTRLHSCAGDPIPAGEELRTAQIAENLHERHTTAGGTFWSMRKGT